MARMKAVHIESYGGTGVFVYTDTSRPEPGEGEVLIHVHAAGVNPIDWKTRQGNGVAGWLGPQPFPLILGWDISGEIEAIGPGVSQFAPGDAVYGMIRFPEPGNAYAEYVTAPVTDIALKPRSITHIEAAAVPLAALTVWQALFERANLQKGQTVLIHAAAGGVGHLAVQLARWKGAHVIGTASARNTAFLHDLGIDTIIDYTKESLESKARDVDVVLNPVGITVEKQSWRVLKRGECSFQLWVNPLLARHARMESRQSGYSFIPRLHSLPSLPG